VHVRRLRAKLGPEHEALIGTVRNVGYKAVRPARGRPGNPGDQSADEEEAGEEAPDGESDEEAPDGVDSGSVSASLPGL